MTQNIYANKIYAHSPISIWTIDDDISSTFTDLETITSLTSVYGAESPAYSQFSYETYDSAYYVSSSSSITDVFAENFGVPLVYGANNITNLYNGSGKPSLIVPGKGFLHKNGKYKKYTFEFWLKIITESITNHRIVGPIGSQDGLYVNGPFLVLKIGKNISSYQIGEFERPMLFGIVYTENVVELLVNGQKVLSLPIDQDIPEFPTQDEDDWIGFYANQDISILQVDCIAIYPFPMSEIMAQLHFVYGQGVETPELSIKDYANVPIVIDYGTAESANNYNYPISSKWENGTLHNAYIDSSVLKSPNHAAPNFVSDSGISFADWKQYNYDETSGDYIRMQPLINSVKSEDNFGLFLNSIVLSGDSVSGFYLTGEADEINDTDNGDVAISISNKTGKTFEVRVNEDSISYVFNSSEIKTESITSNSDFSIIINILDLISSEENTELSSFFSNIKDLTICFGGNGKSSTFGGKIFAFGLLSPTNFSSAFISSLMNGQGGIYTDDTHIDLTSYTGAYSIKPSIEFGIFELALGSYSYWSDIVPLSVLCKQSKDLSYTLSFIQLNIDYPEFSDTQDSLTRTYIRFIETTGNISEPATTTHALSSTGIISPELIDIPTTRYEFVDSNIVSFPADFDPTEYMIKLEIEITNNDILRKNFGIRYLKVNSWLLEEDGSSTIGTKHGRKIVCYPSLFRLYKDTTPYFYLSKNSGIAALSNSEGLIRIPINVSNQESYYLGGIQFAIKLQQKLVDENVSGLQMLIMVIYDVSGNGYEVRYDIADKKLLITDRFGDPGVDLVGTKFNIYTNGNDSRTFNENTEKIWNIITIAFEEIPSFGGDGGYIDLISPYMINDIAEISIPPVSVAQSIDYRLWNAVDGNNNVYWSAYDVDGDNVLDPGDTSWSALSINENASVNLEKLNIDVRDKYKLFIGNNRTVIVDNYNRVEFGISEWKFRKNILSSNTYHVPL